jgi:hypothetical protein
MLEMIIIGPVYIERVPSGNLTTQRDIDIEVSGLTNKFWTRIQNRNKDFAYNWDILYLNNYAQKHVEKWVEYIGWHFQLYTLSSTNPAVYGGTIPLSVTTVNGLRPILRLRQKVFSGDVSGAIGEALLATLMRRRYKLAAYDITHLRATKYTGQAPDFYIRRITQELAQDLEPSASAGVKPPLVVEVKGATTLSQRTVYSKITAALEQVQKLRIVGRYGLVAVFVRDASNRSYHTLLTVVQP